MKWQISYSKRADKFIKKHRIENKVEIIIEKFILKYSGEEINIDVKKLKGKWQGYYRIKSGDLRVIIRVDKDNNCIVVDTVDFRGSIY